MMYILNASRIIELLRRDLVCGLRKKLSNHVLAKHATYHPSPCLLLLLTLPHCVTRHFVSSISTLSAISAAVSVSVFMFLLLGMVSTCVLCLTTCGGSEGSVLSLGCQGGVDVR